MFLLGLRHDDNVGNELFGLKLDLGFLLEVAQRFLLL
jgi:hypothetical protein